MATARPTVSVRGLDGAASGSLTLPEVFTAPIRTDVIAAIHKNMAKNKRQPYAVATNAGHQTSAESWGTGRAVARIPRVGGGGTHRSGQAAFGNMTRGGHMFAPTKLWRRWFVKSNQKQKRYATASALAATALPSLLLARGHKVEELDEVPLVIPTSVESFTKTKEAVAALKAVKAYADVEKVERKIRAGQGKLRGRRYKSRRGPLVVYDNDNGIVKAFRNLPGVELVSVHRLNLLQLAPGGSIGRFTIFTEAAFKQLDNIFGPNAKPIPTAKITNTDVTRIINSDEIQSIVRPKQAARTQRTSTQKKNPLRNRTVMLRLNPYKAAVVRAENRRALFVKNHKANTKVEHREKKTPASAEFLQLLKA
ncbi:60s ribosomal protein l2 [Ceraceosorus bombacis]|uniref:Large ribosomal subunit protein uL4 n=2 Tax=Ceraceosorus TaxID=401624 RepID=A0A0P1BD10_9BASI|nr:putative RPL4A-ribosomal protein L4-A [Ceraceosorus guamensis]PWN42617.1 putative RPL4A-ribosomal protein L4-A [Ceraceosorus guamensis]CEH13220.1 60s ribosomal protein l2 [Ceraceosorus bombacis]